MPPHAVQGLGAKSGQLLRVRCAALALLETVHLLIRGRIHEHGQDDGSRSVDGHGHRRPGIQQIESLDQRAHVLQGGDAHPALADLPEDVGPVRWILAVKRHGIEGHAHAFGLVVAGQVVKPAVGPARSALTGELPLGVLPHAA